VENEDYGMKPMNCPGHILIFQRKAWSYRDMPVRFSEFATVYRYEKSGVTSGLLRVRSLTQDDGHAFVRMDQIEQEVGKLIDIIKEVYYNTFGIKELKFKLSTRDENNKDKYTGSSEVWERATKALIQSLENRSIKYEIKEGEAAFYGPKIDVDVRDAIGRYWQLSTIQLDFFMPDRDHFDLKYNDENNQPQQPVMIHRAIYGSLDRFMGVIIEHFAGAFPLWISPVQVRVVNISEGSLEYSRKIIDRLLSEGIRVDSDLSSETINKKIREAHGDKIPYTLIVGDKEANESKISVRDRKNRQKNLVSLDSFLTVLKEEISNKSLEVNFCSN
jgi:threonyl-tRNA synthetase